MGEGLAGHVGPAEAGVQLHITLIVEFREALWRLESGGNRRIRSNDNRRAALRDQRGWLSPVRLWPFDGPLKTLLEQPGIVVTKTYPGEIYNHFRTQIAARNRSKYRQDDRRRDAPILIRAAKHLDIDLTDSLSAMIEHGFGNRGEGDDRFDTAVGLFGMVNVLCGNRAPGDPRDDARRMIEGWILRHVDPYGRCLTVAEGGAALTEPRYRATIANRAGLPITGLA